MYVEFGNENVVKCTQDIQKHRQGFPSSLKLSNGYILPEGKMTPNTLFVGGIDMKVKTAMLNSYPVNFLFRFQIQSTVNYTWCFSSVQTYLFSIRWTRTRSGNSLPSTAL